MRKYSRRDFIKWFASILGLAITAGFRGRKSLNAANPRQNVIIIVFDSMSARHLSIYGYHRKTTPVLEKYLSHALIYHAHYSPANFTVPGTSSLLTGMYPWKHRAINHSGLVSQKLAKRNLFELIKSYYRVAFGQNPWAGRILSQFSHALDDFLPYDTFADYSAAPPIKALKNDYTNADEAFQQIEDGGSLLYAPFNTFLFKYKEFQAASENPDYPNGLPFLVPYSYYVYFQPNRVLNAVTDYIENLAEPFLGYFHFFPPHVPYAPRKEFIGLFDQNPWQPPEKPVHPLVAVPIAHQEVLEDQIAYDEYILNLDDYIGKMLDDLQNAGVLQNSYVILTSDHGELFERGVVFHTTPLLYEGVVHVPLIIFSPEQIARKDITSPTSSVDILPTLLKLTENEIPDWLDGEVLPGLGGPENSERPIFMFEAKGASGLKPLDSGTIAMRKGKYKIIYYRGYEKVKDFFELYNLENDPEELNNLIDVEKNIAEKLKIEILQKCEEIKNVPL